MSDYADEVVHRIIADLTDRKGLANVWENIDREIRDEIRETWADIIRSGTAKPTEGK